MSYALAYLRFEILRASRNRRYMMLTMVIPAVLYLVLGRQTASRFNYGGLPFADYFAVSMVSFSAIGAALNAGGARLAMERGTGWTRQIRITALSTSGFVGAKVLTAVAVALPGTLLVGGAGVLSGNIHLSAATWVQLYATVWFAILPFAALGMCIGYAFDVDTAQIATAVSMVALSVVGGLFAPTSAFPQAFQVLGKALPTYEMANAGRAALLSNGPRLVDLVGLAAWTAALGGVFAWLYRRDESASSE